MKKIIILIGFILLLGIVLVFLVFSQVPSKIATENSSKNESMQEENNIKDIIYLIEPQDPLWDLMKIELNLTDEQIGKLKELVDAERQRDFVGRSLDYIERDVESGDLSQVAGDKKKKELMDKIKGLPELSPEALKKVLPGFKYDQFTEWVLIQRKIQTIMDRVMGSKPKSEPEIVNEFNNLWFSKEVSGDIEEFLDKYTEKETSYLKSTVGLTNTQYRSAYKVLQNEKKQFIELRRQLTLAKVSTRGSNNTIQQLVNKMRVEKLNSESLVKECLNESQKKRYEMMK